MTVTIEQPKLSTHRITSKINGGLSKQTASPVQGCAFPLTALRGEEGLACKFELPLSTQQVPGEPGLQCEPLSQKIKHQPLNKNEIYGVRERAQGFKALVTFAVDPGSVPSTRTMAPNNFSSRGSATLFCPLWVLDTHVVHIHTFRQNTNQVNKS